MAVRGAVTASSETSASSPTARAIIHATLHNESLLIQLYHIRESGIRRAVVEDFVVLPRCFAVQIGTNLTSSHISEEKKPQK